MSLKFKLIAPVTVAIFLLGALALVSLYSNLHTLGENNIHHFMSNKVQEVETNIRAASNQAMSLASVFTRMPSVQEGMEMAHQGNISDERDNQAQLAREFLRTEMAPVISGYKQQIGSDMQVHFHLPNAKSLLRTWRKKQAKRNGQWVDISDDLSSFRQTVIEVNRTGQKVQGIELGRGGFAIRGLAPIKSGTGKQLGSVEVLINFLPILDLVASGKGESCSLYMNADLLSITTKLQDPKKYPVLDGKFVSIAGQNDDKLKEMITASLLEKGQEGLSLVEVGNEAVATFPIRDFQGRQVGVLAYGIDVSRQKVLILTAELIVGGILLAILLIPAILNWVVLSKMLIAPLRAIVAHLKRAEDGDYSQLAHENTGEMAVLADGINNMIAATAETIELGEEKSREAAEQASKANQALEETNIQKEETARLLERMNLAADRANGISQQVVEMGTELMDQIQHATEGAEKQNQRMAETDESMLEMNATVLDVAQSAASAAERATEARTTAEDGNSIVQNTVESILALGREVSGLKEEMLGLGQKAESITGILDMITDIADQTNLLALNAAIEAARAGDAGRGFAVVADEVRKLAEKTMQATSQVEKSLLDVQKSARENIGAIERAVESTETTTRLAEKSGAALVDIVTLVEGASDQVQAIAAAAEQQSMTSEHIKTAVEQVHDIAGETASGMSSSRKTVDELLHVADELKETIDRMTH